MAIGQNNAKVYARALVGMLLAPADGLYGFFKGFYYFCKSKANYFWVNFTDNRSEGDKRAKQVSATIGLGRVGAVVLATICIVGFIAVSAIPLPGVAPLYTLSILGIAKACGITLGWTAAGRALGAFIGSFFDFSKLYRMEHPTQRNPSPGKKSVPDPAQKPVFDTKRIATGLAKTVTAYAFLGEGGPKLMSAKVKEKAELSESGEPEVRREKGLSAVDSRSSGEQYAEVYSEDGQYSPSLPPSAGGSPARSRSPSGSAAR